MNGAARSSKGVALASTATAHPSQAQAKAHRWSPASTAQPLSPPSHDSSPAPVASLSNGCKDRPSSSSSAIPPKCACTHAPVPVPVPVPAPSASPQAAPGQTSHSRSPQPTLTVPPSSHQLLAIERTSIASHSASGRVTDESEQRRHSATDALPWPCVPLSDLPSVPSLCSLSFNCLDLSDDQLVVCTLHSLQQLDLVAPLQLSLPHLQRFLLAVRSHYRLNPYHNWHHGFHVFQFGLYMLTHSRLVQLLSPLEQLALLVACLCHDVDHPGTTNAFQVAIESSVARVHNEQAVLENHHAFVTCELLRHPQTNFLHSHSALHFRRFRRLLVAGILSTDMAVHFDLCKQFARFERDMAGFRAESESDKQLALNLVIHSSDLSAQVMAFPIATQWEERVTAEFIAQSGMERALGLPESSFMVGLHDSGTRLRNHLNFLQFVMQPLWQVVASALPDMQQCLQQLDDNTRTYRARLAQPASNGDASKS